MELIKIGKFIAERRRAASMTQKQLADKLYISEKTVSKWECGKGLPEASLMLPLCNSLSITVNELLLGESVVEENYKRTAEENMLRLVKENKKNKKKIYLSVICTVLTVISVCTLVVIASFIEMPAVCRILLLVLALLVGIKGIAAAAILEIDAGYYECPACKEKFVPTMGAYIRGAHTITKRKLKCPKCGKKRYCKHVITLAEILDEE